MTGSSAWVIATHPWTGPSEASALQGTRSKQFTNFGTEEAIWNHC